MYKLLFESSYMIIESNSEKGHYYVSLQIWRLLFGFSLDLGQFVLLPYLIFRLDDLKGMDIGFIFFNFGIIYNKSNFVKEHFDYKRQEEELQNKNKITS